MQAIANGISLPSRAQGSVLIADITGFTSLTESLRESLGPRQGAEELSRRLGQVYSALIAEVETQGGCVISFAGDSLTCWFDDPAPSATPGPPVQAAARRAVVCAASMQRAFQTFPDLDLKVAVASGEVRRLVVGDPAIQLLDTLASTTVARSASGEQLAARGEVLVDEETARALGGGLAILAWREAGGGTARFAVLAGGGPEEAGPPIAAPELAPLAPDAWRGWIYPAVLERELQGSFLTEFRPCAAVFVRFSGIDYDAESAEGELDAFIRRVQGVARRHEGLLLGLVIGDKGSYLHLNFGALTTHEDDARRAVRTALELRDAGDRALQIGVTQGLMCVGAFGGATRRAFGALGDDMNLAARLMTMASAGEILVSGRVQQAVHDAFGFEPRPPLSVKGKAEPLPVFAVTGETRRRALRLQEPTYALPMVGRQHELRRIEDCLDLAVGGQGQAVRIVAEAGLGKSRLVAEVIRSARRRGFVGYGGACQSDGVHTPYLAWKPIWQAFFDVDPERPLRRQLRDIEAEIEDRAPSRVEAMPLLSAVLELDLPENAFTRALKPQSRQSALHALLEDCLKSVAEDGPVLVVIEDLHWIDALSLELLVGLARALVHRAVCFVLAYRPPQGDRLLETGLAALPHHTLVELQELSGAEAESAVRAKLAQLYPARGGTLPKGLVDVLMARAQGNPFYLEELLNYVRDRGLDPADLTQVELPDSLHTLILSRIDRLPEVDKTTLRVASIIGRLFRARWLTGYYPELGPFPEVRAVLEALASLDITPLDSPEPELAYLFKHVVTQEVAYESLPFATRARLHERLAHYLETLGQEGTHLLDAICFHFGRSENVPKQREYLRKTGDAARRNYANEAAVAYYSRLLTILEDGPERHSILLDRGDVYTLMSRWDEADRDYHAALALAADDPALKARPQLALGRLEDLRSHYQTALDWLQQARDTYESIADRSGRLETLVATGIVLYREGDNAQSRQILVEALDQARATGDAHNTADALNHLGAVAYYQSDYVAAQAFIEESLELLRAVDDKMGMSLALNGLAIVRSAMGQVEAARPYYEEALALGRQIGNKWGMAVVISNLAEKSLREGDYARAETLQAESLALRREIGDVWGTAYSMSALAEVACARGDLARAQALNEECLTLRRETGDRRGMAIAYRALGGLALIEGDLAAARAHFEASLALGREMAAKSILSSAELGLGLVDLAEEAPSARDLILASLRLRIDIGLPLGQLSSLIGVAALALREGEPTFAAQLLGAVDSGVEALHAAVQADMLGFHAQTLAAARKAAGDSAFESAWEEGRRWSLDEAVSRALEA